MSTRRENTSCFLIFLGDYFYKIKYYIWLWNASVWGTDCAGSTFQHFQCFVLGFFAAPIVPTLSLSRCSRSASILFFSAAKFSLIRQTYGPPSHSDRQCLNIYNWPHPLNYERACPRVPVPSKLFRRTPPLPSAEWKTLSLAGLLRFVWQCLFIQSETPFHETAMSLQPVRNSLSWLKASITHGGCALCGRVPSLLLSSAASEAMLYKTDITFTSCEIPAFISLRFISV